MRSDNRTALVTGASAGLGREFARQLAAEGMALALVARRKPLLAALADELRQEYSISTTVIEADLSDPSTPAAVFDRVTASGLDVTHAINNAGIAGTDLLRQRDWRQLVQFFRLMMLSVAH